MSKVALVTGGTRGIGAAISIALKEAGYTVAATYAGNDEAAAKFKEASGIHVYKWDVGNFDACAEGVAKVVEELGAVDILVNNAGITRDTGFSRMTKDMWDSVMDTNLTSNFNMCKATSDDMIGFAPENIKVRCGIAQPHNIHSIDVGPEQCNLVADQSCCNPP